jgi:hypothetical protein
MLTNNSRARVPIVVLTMGLLLHSWGCASAIPNRSVTGERFPTVSGTALTGDAWQLPNDLEGEPAIVILGFKRKTQFDIDRWLLGIAQLETPVRVLEVPTVGGLFPTLFGDKIDEGMRGGIPPSGWAGVVTVYDDADQLLDWIGTELPLNARVVLLGGDGVVVWMADRGFAPGLAIELDAAARGLK